MMTMVVSVKLSWSVPERVAWLISEGFTSNYNAVYNIDRWRS